MAACSLATGSSFMISFAEVSAWAVRELEESVVSLTAAPGYKLAEYLFVVTTFVH